jgi:hypothetical protein
MLEHTVFLTAVAVFHVVYLPRRLVPSPRLLSRVPELNPSCDVGCGVASFGGYPFERDVVTISVAPKAQM